MSEIKSSGGPYSLWSLQVRIFPCLFRASAASYITWGFFAGRCITPISPFFTSPPYLCLSEFPLLLIRTPVVDPLLFSHSVLFNSLWPHGLWPTRLFCPWDFPGKNAGVGCHCLLQGIFLKQGLNSGLLHWQVDFFFCHWALREAHRPTQNPTWFHFEILNELHQWRGLFQIKSHFEVLGEHRFGEII